MNIKLVSTIPYLTIGSLTWGSVGASVTVDTSALKAYERALIEQEYSAGNLISNPKLTNGRIADAEDVATPSALGGGGACHRSLRARSAQRPRYTHHPRCSNRSGYKPGHTRTAIGCKSSFASYYYSFWQPKPGGVGLWG